MISKSFEIESNPSLLKKSKLCLFFGENLGLKNDLKKIIKEQNKEFSIQNVFQNDILSNKDAFFDELQSYRGLRRQLNVLDANTFTIKHAVSRPSIMLHGFCCDEVVAPFLETFSDTKKGVLQNALIERADFLHRAPRGAPEGYP